MIIDSHCHLNMLDYDKLGLTVEQVIERAKQAGVESILNISVDLDNAKDVVALAQQHDNVFASVGVHPSEVLSVEPTFDDYKQLAQQAKVIAIGETGLDYYYNKDGHDVMQSRFRTQIQVANDLDKPIIVHTRSAHEDTLRIMQEERADQCKGVMHCFTESWEMAEVALSMGFYVSFSGIVTFKNAANVVEVASRVPLDRLLIETDAPYLTPVPYRGKPNQPAHVSLVADKIAEIKQLPVQAVTEATTENFKRLFRI